MVVHDTFFDISTVFYDFAQFSIIRLFDGYRLGSSNNVFSIIRFFGLSDNPRTSTNSDNRGFTTGLYECLRNETLIIVSLEINEEYEV